MGDTRPINLPEPDPRQNRSDGAFSPGAMIGSDYRLLELVGRGGMGVVYAGEHRLIPGTIYAIKILDASAVNEQNAQRFHREALALARLSHDGIVRIYNFGVDDKAGLYYVMEYIKGESLAERIKRVGPLSEAKALELFKSVAMALGYAHRHGIIHRDLKPSNLMLVQTASESPPAVKIVDFGLVRLAIHNSEEKQALTATGEIFGTPYYMSPEQSIGADVTVASDVYSLGCTMFEVLTGAPPFRGENAFITLSMHQHQEPPWLRQFLPSGDFSDGIESMIAKMLSKNPRERYQTMEQLVQDIERIQLGKPIIYVPTKEPASAANHAYDTNNTLEKSENSPLKLLVISVLAIAVAGLVVFYTVSKIPTKRQNSAEVQKPLAETRDQHAAADDRYIDTNGSTITLRPGATTQELSRINYGKITEAVITSDATSTDVTEICQLTNLFHSLNQITVKDIKLNSTQVEALNLLAPAKEVTLRNAEVDFESLSKSNFILKRQKINLEKLKSLSPATNKEEIEQTSLLLSALSKNKNLSHLFLGRMTLSQDSVKQLLEHCHKLRFLHLGRCTVTQRMLELICKTKGLEVLYISDQFCKPAAVIKALRQSSTLKRVGLSQPFYDERELRVIRQVYPDFIDPSAGWTPEQLLQVKKLNIDLSFHKTNYVFIPQLQEWRNFKELNDQAEEPQ